jgi:hypothetical protein
MSGRVGNWTFPPEQYSDYSVPPVRSKVKTRYYQNVIIWWPDNSVAIGAGREQQPYVLSHKSRVAKRRDGRADAIPERLENHLIGPNEARPRSAAFPR